MYHSCVHVDRLVLVVVFILHEPIESMGVRIYPGGRVNPFGHYFLLTISLDRALESLEYGVVP